MKFIYISRKCSVVTFETSRERSDQNALWD
nr:MAG TPA: hypothetical protein [Caudoviricetes sp.]